MDGFPTLSHGKRENMWVYLMEIHGNPWNLTTSCHFFRENVENRMMYMDDPYGAFKSWIAMVDCRRVIVNTLITHE
jgi:hypothetical protein